MLSGGAVMADEADTLSTVKRVQYRGKERETHLLTADNMSVRVSPDGHLVMELFRYGANNRVAESYRFYVGPEDRERLRRYV
jgi:hypothetical protein